MVGPGYLTLCTGTHNVLLSVARIRGTSVSQVEYLRFANLEGGPGVGAGGLRPSRQLTPSIITGKQRHHNVPAIGG